VPFTLYEEGGEGGGGGVWRGLAGDVACVIMVAVLVGRVWQAFAGRGWQQLQL